ncbi:MAG: hypothetical protein HWN71_04650, partial [Desulfobacterales bacterium]|nr:hypothetical protein [Desulfobacterales bacterium]
IFLHSPGTNDTFGPDDVDIDQLAGAQIFHFGYPPVMRRMYANRGVELATLMERMKVEGLTTSLDMAYPDPASEAGQVDWMALLERVLPYVDVFLPSLDEILFMLDRPRHNALSEASTGELAASAPEAEFPSFSCYQLFLPPFPQDLLVRSHPPLIYINLPG